MKKRVVYIEDDPEIINLVRLILSRHGFELIGAEGGRSGLLMVRQMHPDLVLLDLMLPDMDGWEVYRRMRTDEALKDIPVIIITVKANRAERRAALNTFNVNGYITKPFDMHELVQSVRKALGMTTVNDLPPAA
jgi:two-component system response regulator VicR